MTTDDAADDATAAANSTGMRSIIAAGGGGDKGDDDNAAVRRWGHDVRQARLLYRQLFLAQQKTSCVSFLRELIGLLIKGCPEGLSSLAVRSGIFSSNTDLKRHRFCVSY